MEGSGSDPERRLLDRVIPAAAVAELVDAQASGACALRGVEVRVLSAASHCRWASGRRFGGVTEPSQPMSRDCGLGRSRSPRTGTSRGLIGTASGGTFPSVQRRSPNARVDIRRHAANPRNCSYFLLDSAQTYE